MRDTLLVLGAFLCIAVAMAAGLLIIVAMIVKLAGG